MKASSGKSGPDHRRQRGRLGSERHAFTLLEVLVVVLIIGILAASASLTLLSGARGATLDDMARRIVFLDATARQTARRSGHTQRLIVDLDRGTLVSQDQPGDDSPTDSASESAHWTQRLRLPREYQMDHLWLIGPAEDTQGPQADPATLNPDNAGQTDGEAVIDCSAEGFTPSYALSLTGPRQQRRWIIVMGLTGQASVAQDQVQVRSLLSLQTTRSLSSPATTSSTVQLIERP